VSQIEWCPLTCLIYPRNHNIKLLLRTFDGNVPHPDATSPILNHEKAGWVTIHISGSILACLFVDPTRTDIDVVVVWDWKTGLTLGVCETSILVHHR
jgi:hypothetical protein